MKYVSLLLLFALVSCTPINRQGVQSQIDQTQKSLDESLAIATDHKNKATMSNDVDAEKQADDAISKIVELKTKVDLAEEKLNQMWNADGSANVSGVTSAVSGALPPPWNLLVMVGAPIAVGLYQQMRVNRETKAAISLVNGITALQLTDPNISAILKANKTRLKNEYTDRAIELVNEHKLKV